MPKMVISIDGVVIKEVQLTKDRTTLGRRLYNDVVIDNLAVSGEHAVVQMAGNDTYLEDLNSTNGTYVNGKAIKKATLSHNDTIEIGKYKIKFLHDGAQQPGFDKTTVVRPPSAGAMPNSAISSPGGVNVGGLPARIKVLSGPAAGREVPLIKVVTTVGKPGLAVAAITRRNHEYVITHVEGATKPTLNGASIGTEPASLKDGDTIELAGTQMQFFYGA